jgi:hypothetical protein
MSDELVDFANSLRSIVKQSEKFTKLATESIDILDEDISSQKEINQGFFESIEQKKKRIKNLNLCNDELDEFLKLLNVVQADKYEISNGHRGMMADYIEKLVNFRVMENYVWINDLQWSNQEFCVRRRTNEADLKCLYIRYVNLMAQGESVLCSEFITTIQHYSSSEQMQNFFDFIINKFVADHENSNQDDDVSELTFDGYVNLYISKETIEKLRLICVWFLHREEQYELYNEKNEHCDINQKLKFGEIRNDFLKICLVTYFKINTVSSKSAKESKMTKQQLNMNKLVKNSLANSRETSATYSSDASSQVIFCYFKTFLYFIVNCIAV